ncbi:hypothetical protein Tco_0956795 [Tanacetum coccineum]
MINHVNNWEKANKEQHNESVTAELETYKERVKTFEQPLNIDLSNREKMIDSQMDELIKRELALNEQLTHIESNESKEKEDKYMENEIDLEKKIKELDNIIFKVGQSAQTVHMLTKPQAFYDNIHKQALGYQNPFHLKKAQRIKPTLYDGIVILSDDFGKRFTPQQELSVEQAFWLHMSIPTSKPSDASPVKIEAPKELPKVILVNESLKKLKFHLAKFDNVVKITTTLDAHTEVKQAKAKQPLDSELDLASKYAIRIQELLVYVQDTCPNAITPSAKKVIVKPMNNIKKVRFAEPLTSSSKIQQVESFNTSDSNTPVLSSTGMKCSTMNKVNRVVKPVCDVDVKHSLSKVNSKILCATSNKSMFDGVHDKCLLDLVRNGNNRAKSDKKHKNQNIWKPTGHVFTEVGFKWKPTGRTFTIVGNSCPLTRFTSTNIVPPKQTTSHSEPNQTWGSNAIDIPSSSSLVMIGTVRFRNDQIARIMGYGDYQLGNVIISRVYYVEGIGHNLFFVGQFCDADLEVAFRKNTSFIRNLEGVDLLLGSRDTNLYTISLDDMLKSSPICLIYKASKTKSWRNS